MFLNDFELGDLKQQSLVCCKMQIVFLNDFDFELGDLKGFTP
jgi:hypothetical protein